MQSHLEHVAFLGKISRTCSFIMLAVTIVKYVGEVLSSCMVANSVNYISW